MSTRVAGEGGGEIIAGETGDGSVRGEEAGREREDDALTGEGFDHASGVANQPDASCSRCGRARG